MKLLIMQFPSLQIVMFVEKVRKSEFHNTNPYLTQAKCYNWRGGGVTFPNKKKTIKRIRNHQVLETKHRSIRNYMTHGEPSVL
jgi:hypothetical protein